eukprot:2396808-Ditylum_brightwellii.AAC.2
MVCPADPLILASSWGDGSVSGGTLLLLLASHPQHDLEELRMRYEIPQPFTITQGRRSCAHCTKHYAEKKAKARPTVATCCIL